MIKLQNLKQTLLVLACAATLAACSQNAGSNSPDGHSVKESQDGNRYTISIDGQKTTFDIAQDADQKLLWNFQQENAAILTAHKDELTKLSGIMTELQNNAIARDEKF